MKTITICGGQVIYEEERCADCKDYVLASEANERIKVLEDAAKAYRDLCICYRIGKQPTEKLFDKIEKARKALEVKP